MTDPEPKPFTGFGISHPTRMFEVTARGLKLYRRWARSSLEEAKPEFSNSVHGQAVSESDYVGVFGTDRRSKEFQLTINSDLDVTNSWVRIKRIDLLVDAVRADTERIRIRDIQHELFDKSPPIATLSYHEGHWSLECETTLPVLEQLSTDLMTCCVGSLRIQIEWPFGFTEKSSGSWGFLRAANYGGTFHTSDGW